MHPARTFERAMPNVRNRQLSLAGCFAAIGLLAVRAAAHELAFVATLSGGAESPPNNSPGTGHAVVVLDLDLFTMHVQADFSGLTGQTVAAHIHGNTAVPGQGMADVMTTVPSFPDFPAGVMSGTYDHTLDLTSAGSYNPSFIAASGGTIGLASDQLINGLLGATTYWNIHTSAFGGGEIRGFLLPTPKSDFNPDGVVAGEDLAVWIDSFASSHGGDANDDEQTDGSDFLIWQRAVGTAASLPGAPSVQAAPEPAAIGLVLGACGVLVVLRRESNFRAASPGNF
jgi:hypothetical protein